MDLPHSPKSFLDLVDCRKIRQFGHRYLSFHSDYGAELNVPAEEYKLGIATPTRKPVRSAFDEILACPLLWLAIRAPRIIARNCMNFPAALAIQEYSGKHGRPIERGKYSAESLFHVFALCLSCNRPRQA